MEKKHGVVSKSMSYLDDSGFVHAIEDNRILGLKTYETDTTFSYTMENVPDMLPKVLKVGKRFAKDIKPAHYEAVKALNERIASLEARIAALENGER